MRWRVAVVLALTFGALAGCATDRPVAGPMLAVVSYSPNEVVLVDPGTLSVVDRVSLRSMGTSPVALPGRRVLVTAQCGGVGDDADDALAVIDLTSGAHADYLDLPTPNPCGLCALPDGGLVVVHGVWDAGGLAATLVESRAGDARAASPAPHVTGAPVWAGGWLWTVGPEGSGDASMNVTVRRSSADFRDSSIVAECGSGAVLLVSEGIDAETVLRIESFGRSARVERRATADFGLLADVTITGIRDAISSAVVVGEYIVLADGTGTDAGEPGGPLVILDRATLREVRRVEMGGCVSSMAVMGSTLYTVSWETAEIVAVDPATGSVLRRALIPGCKGRTLQMAAIG